MYEEQVKHDRGCWCQNCWEEKLLHPEIVTEEFREYAKETLCGGKLGVENPTSFFPCVSERKEDINVKNAEGSLG